MAALLILLYVLQANSFVIPNACFIVAWVFASISFVASIIKACLEK